jgi:hypothetical protein
MVLHIARVVHILFECRPQSAHVNALGHFGAAGAGFMRNSASGSANRSKKRSMAPILARFAWPIRRAPQLAPMDIIEAGRSDRTRSRTFALDKIIVAIAGPLFSLFLALFFAGVVWVVGHPVGEGDSTTVIGYVLPNSPAQKVGLQPGDKILEVDGKPVRRFLGMNDSVSWNVVRRWDRLP